MGYATARLTVDIFRLLFAHTAFMTSEEVRHRVYMSFQCRVGSHSQFLEQDLKTTLRRNLHFPSPNMVVELVERGGGLSNLESRQALGQAIEIGRGGPFLSLTEEQVRQTEGEPVRSAGPRLDYRGAR